MPLPDEYVVKLKRRPIANGDNEWFLTVAGAPVYGPGGIGCIFPKTYQAHHVLPDVLRAVARRMGP